VSDPAAPTPPAPPPPAPPAPPPEPPPPPSATSPVVKRLRALLGAKIGEAHDFAGEITLAVEPVDLPEVAAVLRDDPACDFVLLTDITGLDFPERPKRFRIVYHLVSLTHRVRLRLATSVPDGEAVPSLVPIWLGADWFEREIFDLFGVTFAGHPDLRRILMPDDWLGYPLRRDYPLPGFPEQHLRYREADVTRRSYVDISWKATGEKAAAIVQKYAGRPPAKERSPHVPE
jgi:NADH-quinone oxidoreductase subunit C